MAEVPQDKEQKKEQVQPPVEQKVPTEAEPEAEAEAGAKDVEVIELGEEEAAELAAQEEEEDEAEEGEEIEDGEYEDLPDEENKEKGVGQTDDAKKPEEKIEPREMNNASLFTGHTDFVTAVCCSPTNPELVATGSGDESAKMWSLSSHKELGALTGT